MKRTGMRTAVLLLSIAGMTLCLAGCRIGMNAEFSGHSDVSYANEENYSVGGAELSETVERIDIYWVMGNVTLKPHQANTVSFSEESLADLTDDTQMRYWLDGTTLHIQFCRSGKWRLDGLEKELTVLVPETLKLANLEVDSVSADIDLDSIQAESASISTTSGNVELTNCVVTDTVQVDTISGWLDMSLMELLETFSWDTTSGALQLTAPAVKTFSANSVSGAVSLDLEEAPEALDVKTTSGNIDLALPEDASFTLDYDSTSGDLTTDLPHRTEKGQYIFGDGKNEYVIGTVSGDVRITKAG